ncbi:hypothetical protein HY994_01915 [Candidatus Micrarchaeota archaeon]|nr:hypothetical protein [Candidatus Micrarchaeota archaeon]
MDEKTARLGLLGLAVLTVIGMVWVYLAYVPVVQSVAAPLLTPQLCANINGTGTVLFASPTSASLCSTLSKTARNLDEKICDAYPAAQQPACKELFGALNDRQSDCLGYLFMNRTEFGNGAPAVAMACQKLKQ